MVGLRTGLPDQWDNGVEHPVDGGHPVHIVGRSLAGIDHQVRPERHNDVLVAPLDASQGIGDLLNVASGNIVKILSVG